MIVGRWASSCLGDGEMGGSDRGSQNVKPHNASRNKPLWVIKMGGSLGVSGDCRAWLTALEAVAHSCRVVVVPGGGVFADGVRLLAEPCAIDEEQGHDLAVRAMQLYGHVLVSLSASMRATETQQDMQEAWQQGKVALWMPFTLMKQAWQLPKKWHYTSDTIALWLALHVRADALFWIKARHAQTQTHTLTALQEENLLDKGLSFFEDSGLLSYCLGPGQQQAWTAFAQGQGKNPARVVQWEKKIRHGTA
ncbi:MAG: hypothetical protein GDA50_03920 [Alphaproteobacteria bacterium GM202ARS2]|nr:hypothetical protein [Alphaproteobacteria bacterium GM202ARS2]